MPGFFQVRLEALPHQRSDLGVIGAEGMDLPNQRSLDLLPVGLSILIIVLAGTVIVRARARDRMRLTGR